METNIICHPPNNPDLRYLLAKRGNNNLLIVGLNPSTANAETADPTSTNIDIIAKNNGYDGWILVNLYPKRATNPANLDLHEEKEIFWSNLHLIQHLLDKDQFKIKDAWLAWGDGIDSKERPYLKQAAGQLYKKLLTHDLNYYCIGRTSKANPRHSSPQSVNCHIGPLNEVELIKFNFKHYVRDIQLEPEIKLDGIKFY